MTDTHTHYDLLIRGGTVIDGTQARRASTPTSASRDGRIAAIGDLAGHTAEQTLDATGRIVAPGFIDSHTHDDQAVLSQPDMAFKVSQGVTTVVAGNCGISAAPLRADMDAADAAEPARSPARGPLHHLRRLPRRAARARRRRSTWRRWSATRRCARVTMADARPRRRTPTRSRAMQALVDEALQAGAIGLSTGTFYPPAVKATTEEIIEVGRPLERAQARST